jgi:hypothetical protein
MITILITLDVVLRRILHEKKKSFVVVAVKEKIIHIRRYYSLMIIKL